MSEALIYFSLFYITFKKYLYSFLAKLFIMI